MLLGMCRLTRVHMAGVLNLLSFRSIRFSPGKNKTWGINFQRNISKNTEIAYWAPLPLTFDIKRLSIAGKLNNLNLKNPKT